MSFFFTLPFKRKALPAGTNHTVRVEGSRFSFEVRARTERIRVIGVVPDQPRTHHLVMDAAIVDGKAVADPSRDLLKMAVIERHRGTGNLGQGFVKGLGLKRGAIAGTIAHDHHNLVVIGADDLSMMTAARAAAETDGGLAMATGNQDQHVLIVEDIVDTGKTLDYLLKTLGARRPASLRTSALLRKPSRLEVPAHIDYLGFDIPDAWVVGYGLDYADQFRTLPYVGVVEPDPPDTEEA